MDIEKIHQHFLNSTGVTTDSRRIEKGQLFFALKGGNFNGNKYAKDALEQGASYAVVDESEFALDERFIIVKNVFTCLQELAKYHRNYLNIPILAITGTNGKTTTKELISTVLLKKYELGFTQGNLNNHIGVPLTLLSFSKETEIGVVEMGANHMGEIAELCEISNPNFGIITNVGKAHIEGFGSFEGVVKTKSELYNYLQGKSGQIFVNGGDEILLSQADGLKMKTYGEDKTFDCVGKLISASPFLKLKWNNHLIETNLVGEYNFNNVLVAICVGSYFGVSDDEIISALNDYQPKNNRSQLAKTDKNTLIIDAYNANPSSMEVAIRNFLNFKEKDKVLILGDMFELGEASEEEHLKIIELVKELEFASAFFIGEHFYNFIDKYPLFNFFANTNLFCNYLNDSGIENSTVLLKASRGIQLEKAIDFL